jgi:hypothetical protein
VSRSPGDPLRGTTDPRNRAVVPAVGKALEASIVLLYVALVTTTLFGGVVPDYRAAAGQELADRTLSTAAHRVQDAVGPDATRASARVRVDLPATIRGDGYRIRAENGSLVLDHPDAEVGSRTTLAVPAHVVAVRGEWHSHDPAAVVVEPAASGVVVRLAAGRGGGSP